MSYEDAYKEIESLLNYGKRELKEYGEGEQLFLPDTLEALEIALNSIGSIQQIKWERDLAISQLKELGYGLGEEINNIKELRKDDYVTKIVEEYNFAKLKGFNSIVIVIETSGGEYEISEYDDGFINDNLDGVYSTLDEIAEDVLSLISMNHDKFEGLRIE